MADVPPPLNSEHSFLRRHALFLGGAGAVAGILIAFIALNGDTVEVDLVVATAELRLAWALLIAAGLGFLVGFLLPRLRRD